jgi:uncharacterized protein with von Willebrand factor type A (vWA) domain
LEPLWKAALGFPTCGEKRAGEAIRQRLVAFVRVLRDNGFAMGLAETREPLALLADPIAKRDTRLRPAFRALFCGRRSDWEKFDEIFAAFWLGRGVKSAVSASGPAGNRRTAPGQSSGTSSPLGTAREPDRVERVADESAVADGRGRREGASRAESFAKTDFRHMTDPAEIQAAYALAERLARSMRVRLTAGAALINRAGASISGARSTTAFPMAAHQSNYSIGIVRKSR